MVDNKGTTAETTAAGVAAQHRASLSFGHGSSTIEQQQKHQRNHSTPLAFKTTLTNSSTKRHSQIEIPPSIESMLKAAPPALLLTSNEKSISSSPSLHSIPSPILRRHRKTKSANISDNNNKKSNQSSFDQSEVKEEEDDEDDEEEEEASSVIIHSDSSSSEEQDLLDNDEEYYDDNHESRVVDHKKEEEKNRQKLMLIEFDSGSDENILMSRINPSSSTTASVDTEISIDQQQQQTSSSSQKGSNHKKSSSTYLKKLINDSNNNSGQQLLSSSVSNNNNSTSMSQSSTTPNTNLLPNPSILAMSGSNESLKNNSNQQQPPPPPYTSSIVSGEVVNTTGSVKDLATSTSSPPSIYLQDSAAAHSASSPLLQTKNSLASIYVSEEESRRLAGVVFSGGNGDQFYDDAYGDESEREDDENAAAVAGGGAMSSPFRHDTSALVFDFSNNSQENSKLSQSSEAAAAASRTGGGDMPTSPSSAEKSKQGKSSSSSSSAQQPPKTKRPWYTAFMNSYKQKNDDFHKLFRLPPEDRLLVDYSCALQREILAHGRLYLSLRHLCFRANIVGWETTLVIKLKDIKSILKDRTVKIIPNAISVILDNEKYFFTSFVARDKTFATLFRVWKTALEETSLSNKEIGEMLRACYGDDLGYSVTDAEYELYGRIELPKDDQVKATSNNEMVVGSSEMERENSDKKKNKRKAAKKEKESRSKSKDGGGGGGGKSTTATTTNSFSDDQLSTNDGGGGSGGNQSSNQLNSTSHLQLSASQSFSPVLSRPASAQSATASSGGHHQKCSSYDAAMINFDDQRPKSMLGETNPNTSSNESNNMGNHISLSPSDSSPLTTSRLRPTTTTVNGGRSVSTGGSKKLTSSPIERTDEQPEESSSSSEEPDSIEDQLPPPPLPPPVISNKPVKCSCERHNDKLMLNQTFNVSVNYMWECIFGHTEFCRKYWESRKFSNTKVGEWKLVDNCPYRLLEYNVDLGGMLGKPKNSEEQKITEYKPNQCIVIESYSVTHGVPYADYFKVHNKFCITRDSATTTRLHITSQLNYIKSPSFLVKGFIESNSMKALKDSFMYLAGIVSREFMNEANETASGIYCHKATSSFLIMACLRNATLNGQLDSKSTKFQILDNDDHYDDESTTHADLEDRNLVKEKSQATAGHISAVDNANIRQTAYFRSMQPVSSGGSRSSTAARQVTSSTTTNSASSPNTERHSASRTQHAGDTTAISGGQRQSSAPDGLPVNVVVEESGGVRQRASRATARQSSHQSDAESRTTNQTATASSVATENNDPSTTASGSQQQQVVQTQLVPIQKFSFFKWEINVDTLVRLFIVAMIFLMVINGMLYYKLRRIESLADNIRSDPNLMLKISTTKRQFDQAFIDSTNNNPTTSSNANREITSWRSAISNTLDAIEKMEISLRQWDKNLELRQQQQQQQIIMQKPPELDVNVAAASSSASSISAAGSSSDLT